MRIKRITDIPDFPVPVRMSALTWSLRAAIREAIVIGPGEQADIPTGFAWEIPAAKVGLIMTVNHKDNQGLIVSNGPYIIDSYHPYELVVRVRNSNPRLIETRQRLVGSVYLTGVRQSNKNATINPGDAFCQLLIVQSYIDELEVVNAFASNHEPREAAAHDC